jgi:hypothetical protein
MDESEAFEVVVPPQSFASADRRFDAWLSDHGYRRNDVADDDVRIDIMRDAEGHSAKRYLVRRRVVHLAHLSESERLLLQEVTARRIPRAVRLAERVGVQPLTIEEREILREALAAEFADTGLAADDEPNARGLEIDRLIGRLRRF